jgi:hypothetical protein
MNTTATTRRSRPDEQLWLRWRWPALAAYLAFGSPLFGPHDPARGYDFELVRGLPIAALLLPVVGTVIWQLRGELGPGSWRRATLSLTSIGIAFALALSATIGRILVMHFGPSTPAGS